MASIRKLKKDINYIAYEMLTEAFAYKHFHPGVNEEKFDNLIRQIIKQRSELIHRANGTAESRQLENKALHYRMIEEDLFKLAGLMEELQG